MAKEQAKEEAAKALLQGMDATDEGTEQNGGGPLGAEAA